MARRVPTFPEVLSLEQINERLDALVDEYGVDYGLTLEVAPECCWSCELRITDTPNDKTGPDRSYVSFAAGGDTARDVAQRAYDDAAAWLMNR